MSRDHTPLFRLNCERTLRHIHTHDRVVNELCKEALRLLFEDLNHFSAILSRHAGIIFDIDPLCHQLTTNGWSNNQRAQNCSGCIDCSCGSTWTTANDHHFLGEVAISVPVDAAWVVCPSPLLLFDFRFGIFLFTPGEFSLQQLSAYGFHIALRKARA